MPEIRLDDLDRRLLSELGRNGRLSNTELSRRQMRNFSGLLAFRTKTRGAEIARRLAERLHVFSYAVSLGKTRSLLFYIPTDDILRTSFQLDAQGESAYRSLAGDGLFRVSVGLEHSDDLLRDLDQGLA